MLTVWYDETKGRIVLVTMTLNRPKRVVYPDSDGEPMAENTKQLRWIFTILGNLDALFAHDPNVFVAGDNFIYAREGDPSVRLAPDIYVAFGRPKGDRGSYKVWLEGGIFPQVVFVVLSPGNRAGEMMKKFQFYETHGAQEYYVYDPDRNTVEAYVRLSDRLVDVPEPDGWTSPLLKIRFDLSSGPELIIRNPDGKPFLTFQELHDESRRSIILAENALRRVEAEREKAEAAAAQVAALRAKLIAAGIDPDA